MDAPDRSATVAVHPSARATVDFGSFRFDVSNRLLFRYGEQVALPPRALAVLAYLLERPNQVVSKQALMDAVWKDTFVEEASLKEAVSLIRQALEEDAQQPRFIQTIHRRGYRFVAPLSLTTSSAAAPDAIAVQPSRAAPRERARWRVMVPVLAVLAAGGLWAMRKPDPPRAPRAVRFAIPSSPAIVDGDPGVAISPDGSRVIYTAKRDGGTRLYERRLDRLDSRELPGTEDAFAPFVSPDGQWVGFFTDDHLKKLSFAGGAPTTVCDVTDKVAGGAWVDAGTIVFGSPTGLVRVSAFGGTPAPLTHVDSTHGEIGHWWPHVLPDGDSVMFTIWKTGLDRASLAVVSLSTRRQHTVYEGGADARYLRSGQLLFARSGGAATVSFDLRSLRVTGAPVSLPLDAAIAPFEGVLQAAVSDDGTLAYVPGFADTPARHTVWMGANGQISKLPLPARPYRNLKLSPDGRRIAATINEASDYDVWIGDIERGTLTRLTFGGRNIEPVWSPDGQWITYASSASTPFMLMRRRSDGSGSAEQVLTGKQQYIPWSSSPNGDALMYSSVDPQTGFDLFVLPTHGGEPWPFVRSAFQEEAGVFSPDGRAVAYVSNESGRFEVYARPYPGPGGKWQVSASGGGRPFWSPDGRRLFYSNNDALMAVDISWHDLPAIGRPFTVVQRRGLEWFGAASGGRVLGLEDDPRRSEQGQIDVVLNWLELVKDRIGSGGS